MSFARMVPGEVETAVRALSGAGQVPDEAWRTAESAIAGHEDGGGVVAFDPETGRRTAIGDSPLDHGERLVPLRHFVLGGAYDDNLVVEDAVTCMRARDPVARLPHDVPDGSAVRLRVG